ncbi:MAG TPA: MarR family transcriptional regulator [Pseudonocardiaceae bacterium]|nr:MarR family transcriptional regulator [Pseudonocardiaceae bacterium]
MARPPSTAQHLADLFSIFAPAFLKWQYAGVLVPGMTYPRMNLIHALAEDGPQIMSALGDRLGVSARNITVLVDGLEKEGFARRVPHPSDRRATIIELTETGRAVHRRVYATHADRAAALFAALPAGDQQHLTRILARLAEALASTSAAEGKPLDLDPAGFRADLDGSAAPAE